MARDLAFFEAHPEQFEALSDEDRMTLANGDTIEGEIDGESPAADDGESQTEDDQAETLADEDPSEEADSEPVVLAKDGKHTIPFEELQTARDSAKRLEDIVRQQNELIESLKKPAEVPKPAESTLDEKLADLQQQIREANEIEEHDVAKRLWLEAQKLIASDAAANARAAVAEEFNARDSQTRAQAAQAAVDAVAEQAVKDYPFLDSNSATANQEAIKKVIRYSNSLVSEGKSRHEALAEAVAEFAPRYVEQKPVKETSDVQAAAEKAIANAKSKTPTSMSSIPAAASPPADEVQAMASMSAQSLQEKMLDLPRDKILELMNKTFVR